MQLDPNDLSVLVYVTLLDNVILNLPCYLTAKALQIYFPIIEERDLGKSPT